MAAVLPLVALSAEVQSASTNSPARLLFDPRGKAQIPGGMSVAKRDQAGYVAPKDEFDDLRDDQVFFRIGSDALTWKAVREQAELMNGGLGIQAGMSNEDFEAMRRVALKRAVSLLMRRYVKNAIIADEARRLGIAFPEGEYEKALKEAVAKNGRYGKAGRRQVELMGDPESFFCHNLRNAVWGMRYRRETVLPTVEVTQADVDGVIATRHAYNLSVAVTNRELKATLEGLYDRIRRGKMDFAKAADEYSECGSSANGGVLGDVDFGGGVRPEIEAAYRKMKPGEITGIVETPYSYHILKLVDFNFDEDDKVRTAETAVGAKMAHVMMEKIFLKPEFTEEQAREVVRNMKAEKSVAFMWRKRLAGDDIYCAISLMPKKGTRTIQRKR